MFTGIQMSKKKETETPQYSVPSFIPIKGPFARWPNLSEVVLAICVFLASVFVSSEGDGDEVIIRALDETPALLLILLAIAAISLYWRKEHPLKVLAVTLLMMAIATALGLSFDFFGVPIALYSVGRYEIRDKLSQLGGATIGLIGLILIFDKNETLTDMGFSFIFLFLSWYIGRRVLARREYLQLLQEIAEQLEKDKVNDAKKAVEEERGRIARELHDVVAHQVSLMTVQAGAAKIVFKKEPQKAMKAMDAVEHAGREALIELRRLLGVIRPDEEMCELTPQPGLGDVPNLVKKFCNAGLVVTMEMPSLNKVLPVSMDLTIYRIIQESLTNVLKHVGKKASVHVFVKCNKTNIQIEIKDEGLEEKEKVPERSGYGLMGMRERVMLLGGTLETKKLDQGGFQVKCYLPFEQE
ncbi:putative two component sensor kinase [Marinomonas sp. MED121]|nr:putative two component sensor kinase [Marinomonas sp. MED121]